MWVAGDSCVTPSPVSMFPDLQPTLTWLLGVVKVGDYFGDVCMLGDTPHEPNNTPLIWFEKVDDFGEVYVVSNNVSM